MRRLQQSAGRLLLAFVMLVSAGAHAGQVVYQYDEAGRLRSVTYPSTSQRTYRLDAAGNRVQTQDLAGGTLQFTTATPAAISEAAGTFTINVTRTGLTSGAVGVSYATTSGTAGTADFTAKSGTLSWADGDSSAKTISISITNDAVVEQAETFGIVLSSATGGAVLGSVNQATATINDDDTVSFSVAPVSVNEAGGVATISITKSGVTTLSHSVSYATANGSALAGSDYTSTSGTLSFAPSDVTKTFTVPVLNDSGYEGDEAFQVNLSAPTAGATLGNSSATITINDNEPPPVFSIGGSGQREIDGSISFLITKTGQSDVPSTVSYSTADNTASAPSDYTASSGTVSFNATETGKFISIPIRQDGTYEGGNETFTVNLTSATGATISSSAGAATGIIVDSDVTPPSFSFSVSNVTVGEAAGSATVTVMMNGRSQFTHSVNYATSDWSTTAGSDYTPAAGVLNFAPGVSSQSFTVPIVSDSSVEGSEYIQTTLTNPTGGATVGSGTAYIQIVDDDVPAVTISDMNFQTRGQTGDATARYRLSSVGDIRTSASPQPTGDTSTFDVGDWLSPKVPAGASFDVWAEPMGGTCSSGPFLAWTNLGSDVEWTSFVPKGTGQTHNCAFRITIRNAATQVQVGTALIVMTAISG
jgi:YD repeat-containing protein